MKVLKGLDTVRSVVVAQHIIPNLNKLLDHTESRIQAHAKPYKGVSSISIADPDATIKVLNLAQYKGRIEPLLSKEDVFLKNLEGYSQGVDVYWNEMSSELQAWVHTKYQGKNKEQIIDGLVPLHIRAFYEEGGFGFEPLGHPSRDFFKLAFRDLTHDLRQFGLITTK